MKLEHAIAKVKRFLGRYSDAKGWKKKDIRLLAQDYLGMRGTTCQCCFQTIKSLSFDHAMPVSRGGGAVPSNIGPMHSLCNRAKGSLTLEEWSEFLGMLRTWRSKEYQVYIIRRLASGWRSGRASWLTG